MNLIYILFMPYVCICNALTERHFRQVAAKPENRTVQDVLIACSGRGKQCATPCTRGAKQILRAVKMGT